MAAGLQRLGHAVAPGPFFDTLKVTLNGLPADAVINAAAAVGYNLRPYDADHVGLSLDETTTRDDVEAVLGRLRRRQHVPRQHRRAGPPGRRHGRQGCGARDGDVLAHPVFHRYHSETEMLRYIFKLAGRDLSLANSMIPLGSCTMKLNGTTEMLPGHVARAFGRMHPFAPAEQTARLPAAVPPTSKNGWPRSPASPPSVLATQRRQPGRVRRAARHPGLPRESRRRQAERLPDPHQCPRHQPGQCRRGRVQGGRRGVRRHGQRRLGRPGRARPPRTPPIWRH